MNYRTIETAIVAYAKRLGLPVIHDAETRDAIVEVRDPADFNLTDLAKAINDAISVRVD